MKEKIPAVSSSSSSPQPTTATDAIWLAYWHPLFLFFFGPLPFHPTHICSGRGGRNLLRFPAYKPRRNSSKVAKCVLYSFHDLLGKTKTRLFLLFIKIPTSPQFPFFTLTQLHNFFPYDTRAPWKREKRSTTPKVFLLGSIQVGFPFWHQPSKASLLYTYVWRSVATHPSKKVSSEPAFPNTEGGGRKKEESFGVRCGSPPSSSSSSSYTLGAPHSLSHPKLHMGGGGGERREWSKELLLRLKVLLYGVSAPPFLPLALGGGFPPPPLAASVARETRGRRDVSVLYVVCPALQCLFLCFCFWVGGNWV